MLAATPRGRYNYPPFTDGKTKVQRVEVTCPRSGSQDSKLGLCSELLCFIGSNFSNLDQFIVVLIIVVAIRVSSLIKKPENQSLFL